MLGKHVPGPRRNAAERSPTDVRVSPANPLDCDPMRNAEPEGAVAETEAGRQILDRRLAQARAVLTFEWLWPQVVAVAALVSVFLVVSWLGVWVEAPRVLRILGVALFAAVLLGIVARAVRSPAPGRREALTRLDRDSGDPHRPISASQDQLANPGADPVTRALWDLHRRRLASALARVEVAAPSPRLVDRDRYALRLAALLALVAMAFVAGPDRYGRVAAAFEWRGAGAPGVGFRLDSWIDPPAYTGSASGAVDRAAVSLRRRGPVVAERRRGARDGKAHRGAGQFRHRGAIRRRGAGRDRHRRRHQACTGSDRASGRGCRAERRADGRPVGRREPDRACQAGRAALHDRGRRTRDGEPRRFASGSL